jgi:hypothetical protein
MNDTVSLQETELPPLSKGFNANTDFADNSTPKPDLVKHKRTFV